jgi:hypothetical protein
MAAMLMLSTIEAGSLEQYPELRMHGGNYPNACNPTEIAELNHIILTSGVKNAELAWQALSTIICAESNNATRLYVAHLLPATIKNRSESTGSEPIMEKIARNEKLVEEVMANGRAWDVTFGVEGEKNIHVQYFQDEACVRGIALSFVKKKWIIDEVSQACD